MSFLIKFDNFLNEGIWTEEKLQEEANKYQTRNEFIKNNEKTYSAALIKGILDELFKNHPNEGYSDKQVKKGYWTKENLQEEAAKYKTIEEFKKRK